MSALGDKIRGLIRAGRVHVPLPPEPPVVLMGWKLPGSAQASGAEPGLDYEPPVMALNGPQREGIFTEGSTLAPQIQRYVFSLRDDLYRKVEEAGIEVDWSTLTIGLDPAEDRNSASFAIVASVALKRSKEEDD